ncbi:SCO family protein [Niabella hibiscisoli]|uniref:SCO family protein n=1 Tax=Niabella hibiscisoli TaxID=1825928 RepID=UPI001F0F79E9|nr:SCO family protein [Niabella hibiscisoli]MCH5718514.1 SCO family protein [Niabella hibiscisoli]
MYFVYFYHMERIFFICSVILILASCGSNQDPLPILGEATMVGDKKIYPRIADFNFINQDSSPVTNASFTNKIYIADFIFLSCPTICPVMTMELKKVYDAYATDSRVLFLSHTIDPERDTIPRLKAYARALGVPTARWHFVTGQPDTIIKLAEKSYYSAAHPDSRAPGGFVHSGGFLLVDKDRHIRGVYNSLRPEETDRLIADIKRLLREQF